MTTYTTKTISEMTDVSIPTLRYYEQIGLLDPVERLANGHRRYSVADLRRIDFLKRLRATNMSISEMQYYVDLYRTGDDTLSERREILEAHRKTIKAQIDTLWETIALLDTKIERYLEQERTQELEQEPTT
ncbi:MAG: MerR family transcriptional regulator [Anaerolineae bacterium]